MTEDKRFIYCFEGIEDKWETIEEYKYTPCTKDGFQDLCEMLNELNEENQQLKKENEQLKQSNKDAWNLIQFIYEEIKEDGSMDWGRIQDLVEF